MKVWIVSTKNFKGKTCIHGITEEGKNVRLLDENGMYPLPDRHSYVPGEIYEMLLRDPVDGGDPFWENKCVVSQKWSGYECNLRQFLLNRVKIERGGLDTLFGGCLRRSEAVNTPYIPHGEGRRYKSMLYWMVDIPLYKKENPDKKEFYPGLTSYVYKEPWGEDVWFLDAPSYTSGTSGFSAPLRSFPKGPYCI
uniref:Uncharacterized protein n=1 Tax=Thermosporothrix sp. COM3 TaxID=2490863 RepID=A0A455SLX8_9CHLR|nr:hypothetical protein KTC_41280 [Thermosporothrix sp. COM3]